METAGEKALPCPGFTGDQNRWIGFGIFLEDGDHMFHGRAECDDSAIIIDHILLMPQVIYFVAESDALQCFFNGQYDFSIGAGSCDEIKSAILHGFYNEFRV